MVTFVFPLFPEHDVTEPQMVTNEHEWGFRIVRSIVRNLFG